MKRGFTLVEILIVVLILGILVALLVPIVQGSIHKAKQKTTMGDIHNMSKAVMSFITDHDAAPANPGGALETSHQFVSDISPYHMRVIPVQDQWNTPFRIWTGTACTQFGIEEDSLGEEDFLIQSCGRDGRSESEFAYDKNNPSGGFYSVNRMTDFDRDLIIWNGSWIRAPRAAQSSS